MARRNAILIFTREAALSRTNAREPYASLPWEDVDALFGAFLGDLLEGASGVADADVFLYRIGSEPLDELLNPLRSVVEFRDQDAVPFTERVRLAIDEAFSRQYAGVVAILENRPTLSTHFLTRLLDQLGYDDECIVVGPTFEGKCYVLGMKSNQSALFDAAGGDPTSKPFLLLERICAVESALVLLRTEHSLDSGYNVAELRRELEGTDRTARDFPRRTFELLKRFDRKYKLKHLVR
jgi:glycosyltransferase A (GT-A) superfamily protein (DUF2064 family)